MFPLLADEDEAIHQRYRLQHIGAYLVVDRDAVIRNKFLDLDHNGWPGHMTILEAVRSLKAPPLDSDRRLEENE